MPLTQNQKDYNILARAMKHLIALTKIDLDSPLKLVEGANSEVIALRMRVQNRMRWLRENDPSISKDLGL